MYSQLCLAYFGYAFEVKEVSKIMKIHGSVNYVINWVVLAVLILGLVLPKQRSKKTEQAVETKKTE